MSIQVQNISNTKLFSSKEEQIQIAKIIKLLDDKIEQSSLQINNLKDYKKGLLQKMFV